MKASAKSCPEQITTSKNMEKLYNIIGDIHGRSAWKDLVDPSRINIFVGDYFDPYDMYSFDELKINFLNIIKFASINPDTILLMGNHDLHYFHNDDISRLDWRHRLEIRQLFLDNIHMFRGVAVALAEKVLVSHAGVTTDWLSSTDVCDESDSQMFNAHQLEEIANGFFWDGYTEDSNGGRRWPEDLENYGMKHFMFSMKAKLSDYYGTSPSQSPVWVRPGTLEECTALPDGIQIVGHTQVYHIDPETTLPHHVVFVDCLGSIKQSLFVDVHENDIKYTVNDHEQ